MALVCKVPLAEISDPLRNRYVAVVAMFACGGLMPAGLVFYIQRPDWSLMYLANPDHIPQLVITPLIMLIYVGSPLLGFWATFLCLKSRWPAAVPILFALCGLELLILLVWGWDRLFSVGYYNDYHYAGQTLNLLDSKLIWTVAGVALVIGGLYVYCLYLLRDHIAKLTKSAYPPEHLTEELAAESPTLPPH
jgi:hypothetical protein